VKIFSNRRFLDFFIALVILSVINAFITYFLPDGDVAISKERVLMLAFITAWCLEGRK
jgi:hypothetical protein